jgi:O-antigen/teichoic acid export membrane protein
MTHTFDRSTSCLSRVQKFFASIASTRLGKNTMWALGGYGLRLLIQAAYFVIIARCLGAGNYGAFIAVAALISAISPFAGLGCGNLLVKNVARDKNLLQAYWGNGLLMTLSTGLLLLAVVLGVSRVLLPHSIPLIVVGLVGVSDLFFVKVLDLAAWAFQSREVLSHNAQLNVLISLTRLIGIAGLAFLSSHSSVVAWSCVYLGGSVVAAIFAFFWITSEYGWPRLVLYRIKPESLEGFYFSVGVCAQTVYNDIDKIMIARLASLEAAGIYTAAYRMIDVVFIPVRALLNAAYPEFFRRGAIGVKEGVRYGRRLLLKAIAYPVFIFGMLLLIAPIVPHVLGSGFKEATEALRWLSLLPLLKALHYFVSDALAGSGHQGLRTFSQASVALFNILINLWLIPAYGWRGAAWSSLASDGLLALVLWIVALCLCRMESGRQTRNNLIAVEHV